MKNPANREPHLVPRHHSLDSQLVTLRSKNKKSRPHGGGWEERLECAPPLTKHDACQARNAITAEIVLSS